MYDGTYVKIQLGKWKDSGDTRNEARCFKCNLGRFSILSPLELLDHFLEKCKGQEGQAFKYH